MSCRVAVACGVGVGILVGVLITLGGATVVVMQTESGLEGA